MPSSSRVRPGLVAAEVDEKEEADKGLGNGVGKGHPKLGCTSGKGGFALQGACECWVQSQRCPAVTHVSGWLWA